MENKKKPKFYTELFDKCSTKDKDSGEFEECCRDGVVDTIADMAKEVISKDGDVRPYMNTPPLDTLTKGIKKQFSDNNQQE